MLQEEVSTRTEYNEAGEVTAVIDERGSRTGYEYDRAGRRVRVRNFLTDDDTGETLTYETVFAYDDNGNQVSVTDALNHLTEYV